MKLLQATADPKLFADWFRDRATWDAWFAFLAALFAEEMTAAQAEIYRQCTGRKELPTDRSDEAWLVCGRRAGKSFVLALVAVYLACFRRYAEFLSPGERGTVLIIATDRRQSGIGRQAEPSAAWEISAIALEAKRYGDDEAIEDLRRGNFGSDRVQRYAAHLGLDS